MLSAQDLTVARGGLPVLEGLNFSVAAGRALVLRGPNGIGKTTLLRVLSGLQPAVAGQIKAPDMVFAGHQDAVKATLSVIETLRFWCRTYDAPTDRIAQAAEVFDLSKLMDRDGATLSAGQKRRLGLARLWVSGRQLWLLDEPTVSLDTASVARFGTALSEHLTNGGAAVLSSHIPLPIAATDLDLTPFRAKISYDIGFDEAFL